MRAYFDKGIEKFIQSPNNRSEVTALTFIRGNSSAIELQFCEDGAVVELASGATGVLMFKALASYGGEDPVVTDAAWTKSGTGTTTKYTFNPSLNTVELNERFVTGTVTGYVADAAARYALTGLALGTIYGQSDDGSYWKVIDITKLALAAGWAHAPQTDSVSLLGEVAWVESGQDGSGPVLTITVKNDLIKGGEGVPTSGVPAYPSPANIPILRLDITGKTGSAATDLAAIATAAINLATYPALYLCKTGTSGGVQGWQLTAGTDAEDATSGIVRPDDYAGTTNEKVWKLVF